MPTAYTAAGPVLAGITGSHQGHVVRYAAAEAARGGGRLLLLYPQDLPRPDTSPAEADHPDLRVEAEPVTGGTVDALVGRSSHASLLVIGRDERDGPTRLPSESAGRQVITHAACPVIVVGSGATTAEADGSRVVAGVDDPGLSSDIARETVRFALRAAERRGGHLDLVHAIGEPELLATGPAGPAQALGAEDDRPEERALSEAVEPLRDEFRGVSLTTRVVRRRPATALVDAAGGAALIVVGSHGRGALRRLALGSVSTDVMRSSDVPVAVLSANASRA
jgi:nucleotide-binding universal stress UspA family protein